MSIWQNMQAAAGKALKFPEVAGVAQFVLAHQTADGGFAGRDNASDLYYTTFALQSLKSLAMPIPAAVQNYLLIQQEGPLDMVHLCCLARCWACAGGLTEPMACELRNRITVYRSSDGGFGPLPRALRGTAYACYLGVGAIEDLGLQIDDDLEKGVSGCLRGLGTSCGGYANEADSIATTPSTAAANLLLRMLDDGPTADEWLLARQLDDGGFTAVEGAPMSDLLSTATALTAVRSPLEKVRRQSCLAFIHSCRGHGGGYGAIQGDSPDCEYAFYALLALGRLAQMEENHEV